MRFPIPIIAVLVLVLVPGLAAAAMDGEMTETVPASPVTSTPVPRPVVPGIRARTDVQIEQPTVVPVSGYQPGYAGMGSMGGMAGMPGMGAYGGYPAGTYPFNASYTGMDSGMMMCPMMSMMMGYPSTVTGAPLAGGMPGMYGYNGSSWSDTGYGYGGYGYCPMMTSMMGADGSLTTVMGPGMMGGMMDYGNPLFANLDLSGFGRMGMGMGFANPWAYWLGIISSMLGLVLVIVWIVVGIAAGVYLVRRIPRT